MTQTTFDILTNAVTALTDAELDTAAAVAREQYWNATGTLMADVLEELVNILDEERVVRARRAFALARTA